MGRVASLSNRFSIAWRKQELPPITCIYKMCSILLDFMFFAKPSSARERENEREWEGNTYYKMSNWSVTSVSLHLLFSQMKFYNFTKYCIFIIVDFKGAPFSPLTDWLTDWSRNGQNRKAENAYFTFVVLPSAPLCGFWIFCLMFSFFFFLASEQAQTYTSCLWNSEMFLIRQEIDGQQFPLPTLPLCRSPLFCLVPETDKRPRQK